MKNLSNFLSENKEDKSEPRPLKADEGADDREYLDLMSEYKQARRSDDKKAQKLFAQAQKLLEKGDVSNKVKLAVAYL